jgi:hypothetical protein
VAAIRGGERSRALAQVAVSGKATTIHPHDLRHAFETLSLDAGASLRDVKGAADHSDPRTTRRYDRARRNLDRHPTYLPAGMVLDGNGEVDPRRLDQWRSMRSGSTTRELLQM